MIAKQTVLGVLLLLLLARPLLFADEEKKRDPGEIKVNITLGEKGKNMVFIRKKHVAKIKLKEAVVIADDLKITHAGTCMFLLEKDGTIEAVPSSKIPMEPGKFFGWVIRADTTRDELAFYELFTVPKNPNWGKDVSVSGDPNTAKTNIDEHVWDWMARKWHFEDGDPPGKHLFTLKIGEKAIGLEFEVVPKK